MIAEKVGVAAALGYGVVVIVCGGLGISLMLMTALSTGRRAVGFFLAGALIVCAL